MSPNNFNLIYEKYWYILLKYAKKILQQQDAEDAVSYTLTKFWEHSPQCRGDEELRAWLFFTLKHRTIDIHARNKRKDYLDISNFDIEYTQKEIELLGIEKEVLHYVTILIKTFTEQEKKIFDLHFLKQLPSKEIGRILKTKPQTVSNQLVTLRRKININLRGK